MVHATRGLSSRVSCIYSSFTLYGKSKNNNEYFTLTVKNPISNTAGINGRTVITIINYNYLNMYTHTHIFTHMQPKAPIIYSKCGNYVN